MPRVLLAFALIHCHFDLGLAARIADQVYLNVSEDEGLDVDVDVGKPPGICCCALYDDHGKNSFTKNPCKDPKPAPLQSVGDRHEISKLGACCKARKRDCDESPEVFSSRKYDIPVDELPFGGGYDRRTCSAPASERKKTYATEFNNIKNRLADGISETALERALLGMGASWSANEMLMAAQQTKVFNADTLSLNKFASLMRGELPLEPVMVKKWQAVVAAVVWDLTVPNLREWEDILSNVDRDGDGYASINEMNAAKASGVMTAGLLSLVPENLLGRRGMGLYQMLLAVQGAGVQKAWQMLSADEASKDRKTGKMNEKGFKKSALQRVFKVDSSRYPSKGEAKDVLEAMWLSLDDNKDTFATKTNLESDFLVLFDVSLDSSLNVIVESRPAKEIIFRGRRIAQYVQECSEMVTRACAAPEGACPRYCMSSGERDKQKCRSECTLTDRCREWQPGLRLKPPAKDRKLTLEKNTFSQIITCVALKRYTSGYDGADWKIRFSPSLRKLYASSLADRMKCLAEHGELPSAVAKIANCNAWSAEKGDLVVRLTDFRALKTVIDGVYLRIGGGAENVGGLMKSAHNYWLTYIKSEQRRDGPPFSFLSAEDQKPYKIIVQAVVADTFGSKLASRAWKLGRSENIFNVFKLQELVYVTEEEGFKCCCDRPMANQNIFEKFGSKVSSRKFTGECVMLEKFELKRGKSCPEYPLGEVGNVVQLHHYKKTEGQSCKVYPDDEDMELTTITVPEGMECCCDKPYNSEYEHLTERHRFTGECILVPEDASKGGITGLFRKHGCPKYKTGNQREVQMFEYDKTKDGTCEVYK